MGLLEPLTRERIAPELRPLWDECATHAPAFENLWATMAHSPTVFRAIWSELLELSPRSAPASQPRASRLPGVIAS